MKKLRNILTELLEIAVMIAVMVLLFGAASFVSEASQIPTVEGPDIQGIIDENDDLFLDFDFTVDAPASGDISDYVPGIGDYDSGNKNGHGGGTGGPDCVLEGHKYDTEGLPLEGWVIGIGSIPGAESSDDNDPLLVGVDTTDADGYYCIREEKFKYDPKSCNLDDFDRENREDSPDTAYAAFEVLQDGWGPLKVTVDGEEETYTTDSFFDVWVEIDLGETETVNFYNKDGEADYTLTVQTSGDGEGVVVSDEEEPVISCDSDNEESDCTETYPAGTVVTLVVTPNEGSNFDNSWAAGAGTCIGNTTPCTVTMNSDVDLIAHFSLGSTPVPSGGGGGGGGRRIELDENGGSGSTGEVLGEQVSIVPGGAPNTGAGGTASAATILPALVLLGLFASFAALQRVTE